jgi:hypothetical protein
MMLDVLFKPIFLALPGLLSEKGQRLITTDADCLGTFQLYIYFSLQINSCRFVHSPLILCSPFRLLEEMALPSPRFPILNL